MKNCKTISVDNFLKLQNKSPKVKLIDTRTKPEYDRENIELAIHIPTDKLLKHKFSQDDILVFHCQSGNRTRQAENLFNSLDVKEVYSLEGGITSWKQASQKTNINTKAPLPIMRQVQMIVGFMVILGVVLGYLFSPLFNIISAFFGAGLLFSGISGSCGLANILMLLPYNKPKK